MEFSASQSDLALRHAPIATLFFRYAVPTIAAMLVTGIYVAVDGMFVGHILGEEGLASIMVGYPLASILYATGNLVGMGAAALVSMALGQNNVKAARVYVGNAVSYSLLLSVITGLAGYCLHVPVLKALGASGNILYQASEYLSLYFVLGGFAVVTMALSPLVRNDGKPNLVTAIMILGGLLNIVLDWLFMVAIPWGLRGAALATMLSQAVTALLCLKHFLSGESRLKLSLDTLVLQGRNIVEITRLGFSSFLMYLYLTVVLTLHNAFFLAIGTPLHVAAYAVVSYSEAFFYLIFEGIALGMQPITSFNSGAGETLRVRAARNTALSVTLLFALLSVVVIYSFPEFIIWAFSGDNEILRPVALHGIQLYFWGLPMEGLLLVGAVYFQSIGQASAASILTGGKLILIGAVMYILSVWFGTDGVWLALPVTSTFLATWMIFHLYRLSKMYH
ncbi:MATE family efflux transporter [Parasalinivibrio latis]|uniref:MATE family efflux transporter n=1 Tax=Parasalinivibrio latis TaxID=2952610 RepID=UPI0030E1951C